MPPEIPSTFDTAAPAERVRFPPVSPGAPASAAELELNVAVARRFVEEGLGLGRLEAFDELVAETVWVSTLLKPDGPIVGREEYKRVYAETIGAALSEASMLIEELLPTIDGAVVVRFSASARHTGQVGPVAPTGARITLNEMHLMRFREGRLVQNHVADLNPQQWGMLMYPVIAPAVLGLKGVVA